MFYRVQPRPIPEGVLPQIDRRRLARGRQGSVVFFGLPRLPRDVRRKLEKFAEWLSRKPFVRDDVFILAVPHAAIGTQPDNPKHAAFGCFDWPRHRPTRKRRLLHIVLGTGIVRAGVRRQMKLSRPESVQQVLETLGHEFAHYRQWRAGWSARHPRRESDAIRQARRWREAFER